MKNIILGKSKQEKVIIDLKTLLRTRLLIQANSGGGKSWLLRLIAERAFGKVQTIIIDPEGEFATLREKYDYVLIGKGGETPADVRSAAMVAHKLLELNASAVCDLYEMKAFDRHRFVKIFLEAMIDAPKKLWHPVLVIVDEAHVFCPESKAGESEATESMIGLATRGRKRGFCPIFATQRLGKLRKDAAAELTNVLIGQTFIDIDRERAAEVLGIPKSEKLEFFNQMKVVEPGNFWALGRAISKERILVKIDWVETTHPDLESERQNLEPPPPPDKIKKLLPKLADLPQLAEAKAKTEQELRAEIAQLKRKLTTAQRSAPARIETKTEIKEVPIILNGELKKIEKIIYRLEKVSLPFIDFGKQLGDAASELAAVIHQASTSKSAVIAPRPTMKPDVSLRIIPDIQRQNKPTALQGNIDQLPFGKGERLCLIAIAQYEEGVEPDQLTQLTGYKRSSRDAYLNRLRLRGFINSGKPIMATPEGIAWLGNDYEPLPIGDALLQYWMNKLPAGEKNVLAVAVSVYPNAVDRAAIDEATGYKRSSRDAYINRLQARRLLEQGSGPIKASDKLFD